MNICGTATIWAKVALVLIFIAMALHVSGFSTDFWQQTETIQENTVFDIGLWNAQNCSGGHNSACDKRSVPSFYITDSFKAVRAIEIIVMIILFVILIVTSLYVATERFRESSVAVAIAVLCFTTVALAVISTIIWIAQIPKDHYIGFSCGLTIVAFVLLFLAGILMIPDIRNHQQRRGNRDPRKIIPSSPQTPRVSKYDEVRRYDYSYNRKFTPQTPTSNVRHYYNPNRQPYANARSPPPTYRSNVSEYNIRTSARTDIQTPDIHLGRDGRRRRY